MTGPAYTPNAKTKEVWARTAPDKMTPDEYQAALEVARLRLFLGKEPSAQPKAIILAGQPGAGKSAQARDANAELSKSGGAVTIDPDQLREFHPRYGDLAKEDHETAATRVHPDASQLSKDLRADATRQHYNLIIDGTLNDPVKAEKLVRELKAEGYQVEVRALAVPKPLSEHGVAQRLEDALADPTGKAIPRTVEPSIQDEAYQGLPKALDHLEKAGIVDRIAVYERGKTVPVYDSHAANNQGRTAAETLNTVRERELTARQKAELARGWDNVQEQAQQRNAPVRVRNEYKAQSDTAHELLKTDAAARSLVNEEAAPPIVKVIESPHALKLPEVITAGRLKTASRATNALGYTGVGIGVTDKLVHRDYKGAAVEGGTALAVGAAFKFVGRVGPVGEVVAAGSAVNDTIDAAKAGHTGLAVASGAEATLYSVAATAGAAAAFNFWNPAGWGAGTVAVVAGAGAVSITAGKAIYNNWGVIKGWFGPDRSTEVRMPADPQPLPEPAPAVLPPGPSGKPNAATLRNQQGVIEVPKAEPQNVPAREVSPVAVMELIPCA